MLARDHIRDDKLACRRVAGQREVCASSNTVSDIGARFAKRVYSAYRASTPNKRQGLIATMKRERYSDAKMASAPAVEAQGVCDEGVWADLLQRTKRIRPVERWDFLLE